MPLTVMITIGANEFQVAGELTFPEVFAAFQLWVRALPPMPLSADDMAAIVAMQTRLRVATADLLNAEQTQS